MKIIHTKSNETLSVDNTFSTVAPHINLLSSLFNTINTAKDLMRVEIGNSCLNSVAFDIREIESVTIGTGWVRVRMQSGSITSFYESGFFNSILF